MVSLVAAERWIARTIRRGSSRCSRRRCDFFEETDLRPPGLPDFAAL